MNFSTNVQQAIDLGLLSVEDGKIVSCRREEAETITAISRVIEKIQPTTAAQSESTTDQEAIVLARILSSITTSSAISTKRIITSSHLRRDLNPLSKM